MTEPEPCTTWSRRLKHYSRNLTGSRFDKGRTGLTLCNADAMDQENVDHWLDSFSSKRSVVIADLPECKKCARRRP